ncbi:unnamed protein product [Mesocestoides corti]|uniref:Secreted protein n=1 Tax=Mesocestoides corti TaxID=53468 RepID=A0A0R3UAM6_MESCO|nr:unnamed protein product [Mesocestoides corti]
MGNSLLLGVVYLVEDFHFIIVTIIRCWDRNHLAVLALDAQTNLKQRYRLLHIELFSMMRPRSRLSGKGHSRLRAVTVVRGEVADSDLRQSKHVGVTSCSRLLVQLLCNPPLCQRPSELD